MRIASPRHHRTRLAVALRTRQPIHILFNSGQFPRTQSNPRRGFKATNVAVGGSGRRHTMPVCHVEFRPSRTTTGNSYSKVANTREWDLDGVLLVAPAMHTTKYKLVRETD
jgi:hypothetical protein